ncbi:MAG: hypothetical protein J0H43_03865, partial [Actinobacteria bacterium]|nr:hypothetical protein [Actinomycetota bacterium]
PAARGRGMRRVAETVKYRPAPLGAAGWRWLAAAGARAPRVGSESAGDWELERADGGRLDHCGEEELGRRVVRELCRLSRAVGGRSGPTRCRSARAVSKA